jgi:hypothetical protein
MPLRRSIRRFVSGRVVAHGGGEPLRKVDSVVQLISEECDAPRKQLDEFIDAYR